MGYLSDTSFPDRELDVVFKLEKFKQNGGHSTVYTFCSIQIFKCYYFLNATLKTDQKLLANAFSASLIDSTPPDSQMWAGKHRTGASSVFFRAGL